MHFPICLPLSLAVLGLAGTVFGQDPGQAPRVASTRDVESVDDRARPTQAADRAEAGQKESVPYWSEGNARGFMSATIYGGLWSIKPGIAAGYGRPHYQWMGFELESRVSDKGGTEYVGLRAATPAISLRAGGRYTFGLGQAFLDPDDSYTHQELDADTNAQQHYFALDAELTTAAKLRYVKLVGTLTGMRIEGVPSGYWVLEDSLRVVVAPPWVWRARASALVPFGPYEQVEVGAAGEVLGVPEREALVGRLGPVLSVAITPHLDAQATVLLVVASRDRIGLAGADFGQLGLRYRWASGEPRPAFP